MQGRFKSFVLLEIALWLSIYNVAEAHCYGMDNGIVESWANTSMVIIRIDVKLS